MDRELLVTFDPCALDLDALDESPPRSLAQELN